jgi:putative membrane protein
MLIVSKVQPSPIFPLSLLATFVVIWVTLAIAPLYRLDWALENSLVLVAVSVLVMSYRHLRLSNAAYSMIFLFLVFHEIGAHYTYSKVPYEQWLSHLHIAVSPAHRNDYDRLVHFLYGLLITPAATELISKVSDPRGMWRWLLPISFIMSHSLLYELIEWWAAVMFGGDLGVAYLGTQGDPWDAQRDMFAATIGSVIAMAFIYLRRLRVGI